MSKVFKSGKIDNVIGSMDAGNTLIVKFKNGTVTALEKREIFRNDRNVFR